MPIQDALSRFAVSTGVTPGALARLPIPPFSQKNPDHLRLSELGAMAVALSANLAPAISDLTSIETEIDEIVWVITVN